MWVVGWRHAALTGIFLLFYLKLSSLTLLDVGRCGDEDKRYNHHPTSMHLLIELLLCAIVVLIAVSVLKVDALIAYNCYI